MKKILVLCTGNSCRSQMADGYLRHFAAEKAEIYSAGVEVHGLNPRAVAVMKEDGIDISHQTSNHISEYKDIDFDFVLTMCDHAKESCPIFSSKAKIFHHNFPDPAKVTGTEDEIMYQFKIVRDQIKQYCIYFIRQINTSKDAIQFQTVITCPACGYQKMETMPADACQYFYQCEHCKTILKPLPGDCCVYCSYGTVKCPSKQME